MRVPCYKGVNCNWPACDSNCEGKQSALVLGDFTNDNIEEEYKQIWNAAIEAA